MKGFKVNFREKEMNIAPEFSVGFMITNRNGNYDVSALGLHEDSVMVSIWIDTAIEIGESIQIDVMDLNEGDQPFLICKAFSNEKRLTPPEIKDMHAEQLETFYVLENLLKKEGIL